MYSPAKIKMFGMIKGMQGCYQTINPPPFVTFLIKTTSKSIKATSLFGDY